MLKLLQRLIPFTILAVLCATVSPGGARAQVARDAAVVYQEHIDAINRGDTATAAAVFTSDGVLIHPGCPASTGCVGAAAIQARIQAIINGNARVTIVSIQRNNNIITAVEEHRSDAIRAAGLERAVFEVTMTFTGDKIARRVLDLDLSDPQSARFAAFLAPPASTPAAVVPPATGDGGLISGHGGTILVPEFAALLLSVLLAGLIMTRRRV